jgi:anaerobic selenocysteine-containing dehydrogenase
MLVMMGGNPVYNTPADLKLTANGWIKFRFAFISVSTSTKRRALSLARFRKHYLEAWSDARAFDGTVSIVQPLIKPLYDSKSAHEVVQLFFARKLR